VTASGWSHISARAPDSLRVSAIVVSYRTGPVLMDCLWALEADPDVHEVVLVDNGNPHDMLARVEALRAISSKLKVTGGGVNRGFAAGVNLGVMQSTGDRLLILNPDALLRRGSIAALETARIIGAEPSIAGGCIFGTDGVEQRGGRRRCLTLASAAATFLGLGWLKVINPAFVSINLNTEPAPSGPIAVDAVSGALMFLSRCSFERLGGMDEGYFLHVEDVDFCRRAEADGGSVIYTPFAAALHYGATSEAPSATVERYKAAGLSRYFHKFATTRGERWLASLLGPLFSLALMTRARMRAMRNPA
jgi:N-acetylglucosaminyl-diphospho-decaprenol L-rhamnosyltransferase